MLSNTCKYAIRAVVYLAVNAQNNERIGIKEISKALALPSPFLSKILQNLAKQKLLISTKGPHGGFALGRSPEQISLLDIVEIIDGLSSFDECLVGLNICKHRSDYKIKCPLHKESHIVRNDLKKLFEKHYIADLAEEIKQNGISKII